MLCFNGAKCIAMNLKEYTDSLPHGGVSAFAAKVGVSAIYLHQLAARQTVNNREREASPELAVVIERESDNAVRRWDLRPNDWWLIWPELIQLKGAPEVAEKAA